MATSRKQLLGEIGEQQLIQLISGWLGAANPPPPRGMGDDCAVLPVKRGRSLLATVDPVIRGQHFTTDTPPAAVATKLLHRNISDVAAMGGAPTAAIIALAAPPDLPVAWLRSFYRTLAKRAVANGLELVGGDCSQTDGFLGAFLTLLGAAPPKPLTRTGARAGDQVFVSGSLGGSILGRHLRFSPRLREGQWLAETKGTTAAIDLSDGLAKDAPSLAPTGAHLCLSPERIPVSRAAHRLAKRDKRHPLDCALNDGEDYELLFTVAPRMARTIAERWQERFATPLTQIGEVRPGRPDNRPLTFEPPLPGGIPVSGYEHFR